MKECLPAPASTGADKKVIWPTGLYMASMKRYTCQKSSPTGLDTCGEAFFMLLKKDLCRLPKQKSTKRRNDAVVCLCPVSRASLSRIFCR